MTEKKCGATEKDFQFWMPLDIVKAPGGEMRVGGIATDESSEDIQGEKVFVDGLDISYLKERGAFNWNHQKGPGDIIGEIDIAQKQGGKLYVEGPLYPHMEQAKHVYSLLRSMKEVDSKRRLGLSIEGKIKERDALNTKLIKKAWIKNVAITYNPINQGTWVDMIKSLGDFQYAPCDGDCSKCSACSCPPEVKKAQDTIIDPRVENPPSEPVPHPLDSNTQTGMSLDQGGMGSQVMNVCVKCGKTTTNNKLFEGGEVICDACKPPIILDTIKAISAGHDIPATTGGVSGSALRKESMEKKKKTTTFDKKDMTKGELAKWFFEKGYTVNEAASMAHLIFNSVDLGDLSKAEGQVAGFHRVRRGHAEYVKPHRRTLTAAEHKKLLTSAIKKWTTHRETMEAKGEKEYKTMYPISFAEYTQKTDPATYKKLIQGMPKGKSPSRAGQKMTPEQRKRVVTDFAEVIGLPGTHMYDKQLAGKWLHERLGKTGKKMAMDPVLFKPIPIEERKAKKELREKNKDKILEIKRKIKNIEGKVNRRSIDSETKRMWAERSKMIDELYRLQGVETLPDTPNKKKMAMDPMGFDRGRTEKEAEHFARTGEDIPEQHKIKIAKKTLKMPDAMANVMGGPSKKEARKILKRKVWRQQGDMPDMSGQAYNEGWMGSKKKGNQ